MAEVELRKGREGARWINERPTSEEFGKWFHENVKLDPALDPEEYVGGIVLIPAVDTKAKRVIGFNQQNGTPIIAEGEELSYIPYPKVETRINYFWNLLAAHEEWVGVVEDVTPPRLPIDPLREVIEAIEAVEGPDSDASELAQAREVVKQRTTRYGAPAMAQFVHTLPEGFHVMSVPVDQGYTHFLCCTKRVAIYKRGEDGMPTGLPLREGKGTKMVPMVLGRQQHYADPNVVMKAETGALGRALGFAGIFNIPGSGIATAEDMQEALNQGDSAVSRPSAAPQGDGEGPATPAERPVRTGAEEAEETEEQLKARASALWKALNTEHPERATEFGQWAQARRPPVRNLGEARGAALRGIVKKLEKLTEQARESAEQAAQTADTPIEGEADAPETMAAPGGPDEPGSTEPAPTTDAPGEPDGEPSGS